MPRTGKPINEKLKEVVVDIIKGDIAETEKVIAVYWKAFETFKSMEAAERETKEFSEEVHFARVLLGKLELYKNTAEELKRGAEELLKKQLSKLPAEGDLTQQAVKLGSAQASAPKIFYIGKIYNIKNETLALEAELNSIKKTISAKRQTLSAELQSRLSEVQTRFIGVGSFPEMPAPSSSLPLLQKERIHQQQAQKTRVDSEKLNPSADTKGLSAQLF